MKGARVDVATPDPVRAPARLLTLKAAAERLGVSYWMARDLVIEGVLPHVRLPSPRSGDGREMRRILIDERDVERLIDRYKTTGQS
jgi:hypothetical protein